MIALLAASFRSVRQRTVAQCAKLGMNGRVFFQVQKIGALACLIVNLQMNNLTGLELLLAGRD